MNKFARHTDQAVCLGCVQRLAEAKQELGNWFWVMKQHNPYLHVAWAYRDEENQNRMHAEGASKLVYPNSKHNKTDADGRPDAEAIDLFEQYKGEGHWSKEAMTKVNAKSIELGYKMRWGGDFKSLGDYDHFELVS